MSGSSPPPAPPVPVTLDVVAEVVTDVEVTAVVVGPWVLLVAARPPAPPSETETSLEQAWQRPNPTIKASEASFIRAASLPQDGWRITRTRQARGNFPGETTFSGAEGAL